jgi:hypothetical protein
MEGETILSADEVISSACEHRLKHPPAIRHRGQIPSLEDNTMEIAEQTRFDVAQRRVKNRDAIVLLGYSMFAIVLLIANLFRFYVVWNGGCRFGIIDRFSVTDSKFDNRPLHHRGADPELGGQGIGRTKDGRVGGLVIGDETERAMFVCGAKRIGRPGLTMSVHRSRAASRRIHPRVLPSGPWLWRKAGQPIILRIVFGRAMALCYPRPGDLVESYIHE